MVHYPAGGYDDYDERKPRYRDCDPMHLDGKPQEAQYKDDERKGGESLGHSVHRLDQGEGMDKSMYFPFRRHGRTRPGDEES